MIELGSAALLLLFGSLSADEVPALPADVAVLSAEERGTWLVRSIRVVPPLMEAPLPFLVDAGRAAPDHLVEMLCTQRVPTLGEGDGELQKLSIYQHELLRQAFVGIGPEVMLPAAQRAVARHDGPRAFSGRAAAIELYGLLGDARALKTVVRYAAASEEDELDGQVDEALEVAVADLVARHPEVHGDMRAHWRGWRYPLLSPVLRGIGRSRDSRGLPFLGDVMSWHEDLAVLCMSQVRLVGPSPSSEANEAVASIVRDYLEPEQPQLCRAAALALGDLEDAASIPALLDLLESGSPGIGENALWSLRKISGLSLNDRTELWRSWYGQERTWFSDEAPALFQRLASPRDQDVSAAIREIGKHRLYRHELARELAVVLEHESSRFRARGCRALALLGAVGALPDLIRALDDAEEEVFLAAHAALVQLAGRDLGQDPAAWHALVTDG